MAIWESHPARISSFWQEFPLGCNSFTERNCFYFSSKNSSENCRALFSSFYTPASAFSLRTPWLCGFPSFLPRTLSGFIWWWLLFCSSKTLPSASTSKLEGSEKGKPQSRRVRREYAEEGAVSFFVILWLFLFSFLIAPSGITFGIISIFLIF